MICEVCEANAEMVRPNHYKCKYCGHEFDLSSAEKSQTVGGERQYSENNFWNNNYFTSTGGTTSEGKISIQGDVSFEAPKKTSEADADSKILSGEELYEQAIQGVVEIYAANKNSEDMMCSSGFVISEQGFILTNAHAVLDAYGKICDEIQVKTQDDKVYRAFVIAIGQPSDGKHDSVDLCLLYVDGLHITPNRIGDVSKLKNGQKVYLIGNSLGAGICITSGIISDKEREMPGLSYPYIMTDAAANPGNSGGPLYNECGEVIGVLVAGIDGAKGMNYAIPANVVDAFLSFVVNGTKMKNANIGDLDRYAKTNTNYALSMSAAFGGIKLLLDVIEFIVGIFKKK